MKEKIDPRRDGNWTNKRASTLNFGNRRGNGEQLEGRIKIGFCNLEFSDSKVPYRRVAYFASHTGEPEIIGSGADAFDVLKEKIPLARRNEGKIEIRYPGGEWKPFFLYLGSQIDGCLGRGCGILSWPGYEYTMTWDKFLELPESNIQKNLKKVGFDGGRAEEIVEILRQYKENLKKEK